MSHEYTWWRRDRGDGQCRVRYGGRIVAAEVRERVLWIDGQPIGSAPNPPRHAEVVRDSQRRSLVRTGDEYGPEIARYRFSEVKDYMQVAVVKGALCRGHLVLSQKVDPQPGLAEAADKHGLSLGDAARALTGATVLSDPSGIWKPVKTPESVTRFRRDFDGQRAELIRFHTTAGRRQAVRLEGGPWVIAARSFSSDQVLAAGAARAAGRQTWVEPAIRDEVLALLDRMEGL